MKNKNQEIQIPLIDILNVSYVGFFDPPFVSFRLRKESVLGSEICFIPRKKLLGFPIPSDIESLIERIDEAKIAYGAVK